MKRPAELRAASFFVLAGCAAIGVGIAFVQSASTELLGALLAIAFGGVSFGLVTWANRLMPPGPFTEDREPLESDEVTQVEAEARLEAGGDLIARRSLLVRTLGFAGIATGAAALLPLRSLGPQPGHALSRTPWRTSRQAITEDGRRVVAADIPVGGVVTIFPEGHPGSADGQAVVVRLEPDVTPQPREGRDGWSPDGLIAFSRVCTHAGCPVGLYASDTHQLLCPCHQSAFDVLRGAKPVFGPAAAPLPQLPITIDSDGYVVATGDFSDPVGPAYWHRR